MAKGQKRSNKEVKKPKQVKTKPSAETSGLIARSTAPQGKGRKS
jgi:hypothetical protein